MLFENRAQAARQLAERLQAYADARPLILAIPRGAVPMAQILAERLHGDLDVVLVRKLGAPGNPELAIGSVDELGHTYLGPDTAGWVDSSYIDQEREKQMDVLRRRRAMYTPVRPPISPADRVAIVVDDGIATGSTMIAALRAVRAQGPAKLVAATAVAPPSTVRRIAAEADEVICLATPVDFAAIGQFFADFSQVDDAEVCAILQEATRPRKPGAAAK
ncbi:MAG TPA: phosphoribosyltransferase family protein [Vicinamibacterales bacterium]|nr:phosphoribosyltransferase family protein [Vicinamibacterales bacterium]